MRLVSAAICALGAHALLYGSFRPADGMHGYLGWYEPALPLAAIAAVIVFRPACLRSRLPLGETARALATRALVIVLVQESLERTLHAGHPTVVAMTPSEWLVLLAALAATALALSLALRAGQVVFARFVGRQPAPVPVLVRRLVAAAGLPARRPLAGNVALRAPPVLAR